MTVVNPKSISGINSITTGSGSDNLLTIHTSDASSTERVRINSSGDVIVGSGITVSPDGDVFTTGVTTATTFVGALTGTASGNPTLANGSNNRVVTATGANGLTGESTLLFDGNLIIDSDSGHLQIGDDQDLDIYHNGSNGYIKNGTGQLLIRSGTHTFENAAGSTEYARIDSSGKVNIGNTGSSWVGPLSIGSGASGQGQVLQLYSNSDTYGAIFFGDADSGAGRYVGDISYYHDSNYMRFSTSGSERFRILSNGDFGFNDTAPAAHASGNNTVLSIKGKGSSYSGKIDFKDSDGNVDSYINSDNAVLQIYCDPNSQNGNTAMNFSVHGSNRMQIGAGGDIDVETGDIFFSTAGKGIVLGATSNTDANTLDDYEEGTYTPTNHAGTATFTNNVTARYRKIGQMVYVQFDISINSSDSGTNSGMTMPFASSIAYGSGVCGWTTLGRPVFMHISGAYAYFMDNSTSGNSSQHLIFNETSGHRFIGNFWYIHTG